MNKPESSKELDKRLRKLIETTATQLGEHFTAVRIIATWDDCGETQMAASGSGNDYAQMGMTQAVADMDRSENEQSAYMAKASEEAADPDEDPPQSASI